MVHDGKEVLGQCSGWVGPNLKKSPGHLETENVMLSLAQRSSRHIPTYTSDSAQCSPQSTQCTSALVDRDPIVEKQALMMAESVHCSVDSLSPGPGHSSKPVPSSSQVNNLNASPKESSVHNLATVPSLPQVKEFKDRPEENDVSKRTEDIDPHLCQRKSWNEKINGSYPSFGNAVIPEVSTNVEDIEQLSIYESAQETLSAKTEIKILSSQRGARGVSKVSTTLGPPPSSASPQAPATEVGVVGCNVKKSWSYHHQTSHHDSVNIQTSPATRPRPLTPQAVSELLQTLPHRQLTNLFISTSHNPPMSSAHVNRWYHSLGPLGCTSEHSYRSLKLTSSAGNNYWPNNGMTKQPTLLSVDIYGQPGLTGGTLPQALPPTLCVKLNSPTPGSDPPVCKPQEEQLMSSPPDHSNLATVQHSLNIPTDHLNIPTDHLNIPRDCLHSPIDRPSHLSVGLLSSAPDEPAVQSDCVSHNFDLKKTLQEAQDAEVQHSETGESMNPREEELPISHSESDENNPNPLLSLHQSPPPLPPHPSPPYAQTQAVTADKKFQLTLGFSGRNVSPATTREDIAASPSVGTPVSPQALPSQAPLDCPHTTENTELNLDADASFQRHRALLKHSLEKVEQRGNTPTAAEQPSLSPEQTGVKSKVATLQGLLGQTALSIMEHQRFGQTQAGQKSSAQENTKASVHPIKRSPPASHSGSVMNVEGIQTKCLNSTAMVAESESLEPSPGPSHSQLARERSIEETPTYQAARLILQAHLRHRNNESAPRQPKIESAPRQPKIESAPRQPLRDPLLFKSEITEMMKKEMRQEMGQLVQKSETRPPQDKQQHHFHNHQASAGSPTPRNSCNVQSRSHTNFQGSKSQQLKAAHSVHGKLVLLRLSNIETGSDFMTKTSGTEKLASQKSKAPQVKTLPPIFSDDIKAGTTGSNQKKPGAETSWFDFLENFLPYFETIEECLDHVAGEIGKILVSEIVELTNERGKHGSVELSTLDLSPPRSQRELKLSPAISLREVKLSPAISLREVKVSPPISQMEVKLSPPRSHREVKGKDHGSVENTENPLQSLAMIQAQSVSPLGGSRRDTVRLDVDSSTLFHSCILPSHYHQSHWQGHTDEDTSRAASELDLDHGQLQHVDNPRCDVSPSLVRRTTNKPRGMDASRHSDHESFTQNSHQRASMSVHSSSNQSRSASRFRAEARLKALGSHSQDHVARPIYPILKTNSFHFLQAPGESNLLQQESGQSLSENTLSGKLSSCYEKDDESVSTEDCFSEQACGIEALRDEACGKPSKKTAKLKKALKTKHRSLSEMKERKRFQPPLAMAAAASSLKEDTDIQVEKSLKDNSSSQQPSVKDNQPSISLSEFKTVNSYTSDQPTIFLDTLSTKLSADAHKSPPVPQVTDARSYLAGQQRPVNSMGHSPRRPAPTLSESIRRKQITMLNLIESMSGLNQSNGETSRQGEMPRQGELSSMSLLQPRTLRTLVPQRPAPKPPVSSTDHTPPRNAS